MTYTITINASTPEELSAILAKLHMKDVQAPVAQVSPIQDQPSYQQHQAIAQHPVQPGFTPNPSAQYQQQPTQQIYGQQQPIQQGFAQQNGYNPEQSTVPTSAPIQQQPGQVPTAQAPTYTMEMLGVAASPIIDAGRSQELLTWINQRGAAALSQLDKAHYGDFATYLRSLGVQI